MKRFQGPSVYLSDLAMGDIAVVCPRCAGRAVVGADPTRAETAFHRARQLTCPACGYTARWPGERAYPVWGVPVDPFFRRPLWLRARWRGHTVWAYHLGHLDLLESFIAADLRGGRGGNSTVVSRLPRWMTSAKNRNDLLPVLADLRKRVSAKRRG